MRTKWSMSSKRTALYDEHKKAGARFTEFAGWEMPVLYAGIVKEHLAVRGQAGLFDISHMGQVFVKGKRALDFLQKICTNDISKCAPGKAIYSHMCNERGGVVDDIFVYCLSGEEYLVVVNAATTDKDVRWMTMHNSFGAELDDRSAELGMIALQGPAADAVAGKIFKDLPSRHAISMQKFGLHDVFICRTGYTGEDGFEFILPASASAEFWKSLMECGGGQGLIPCGLGARDTLRLEVGYPLYGLDIDDDHSPLEAGLNWVVKLAKADFVGKPVLEQQKSAGLKQKLTAFKLKDRGIPRHGSQIFCKGAETGVVTSGTFSPSLQIGIAVGYLPAGADGAVEIECHSKKVPAEIVSLPFYSHKRS